MICRVEIALTEDLRCDLRIVADGDLLLADEGFATLSDALVAAIESLPADAVAVELCYGGVVSGTYVLDRLAHELEPIAAHAVRSTAAVVQALRATG